MKKSALSLLLIVLIALCFCAGCSTNNSIPEKPNDSLEFWIAQDVSSVDFSEYFEARWLGARQFYGKGYYPEEVDENGHVTVEPKYCVKYSVGAYPDEADGGLYIVGITIIDPTIDVYGLTCNSSLEEFDKEMKERGYTIIKNTAVRHTATLGKVSFVLVSAENEKVLSISVEVTNKTGIVYD